LRAFAKLNLALDLLGLREDGFTELSTVFQSIELHDRIDLAQGVAGSGGAITLVVHDAGVGLDLGPADENLCWRAAHCWKEATGCDRSLAIDLHKAIPVGAGLGGGSSDAAAVLWGLQALTGTPDDATLGGLARRLGADVPYFLSLGTALGLGRGDLIQELPDLPRFPLVLARVGPPLSTAAVFAAARGALTPSQRPPKITRLLQDWAAEARGLPPLGNDLTPAAVAIRPEIERMLTRLRAAGGVSEMSGSGCVVFSLFETDCAADRAAAELRRGEPDAWVVRSGTISRVVARNRRRIDPESEGR
jgi:4-diphosphocytidyl-2-C-methyl-D-erythritol kinase